MTERTGLKVGTGSIATEGMGLMGSDTHRQVLGRKAMLCGDYGTHRM